MSTNIPTYSIDQWNGFEINHQLFSISLTFTEAQYAYKRKRPVIPLLVQDGYDPDGWLGLIVGTKLYYKFCSDKDTDVEGLLKGIREIGKIVGRQNEFQKGNLPKAVKPGLV